MIATHNLVAKTAKEIAGAFYEEAARDNAFFAAWPKQRNFIRKCWGSFVPPARESLAKMLAGDYPAEIKEQIAEALMLDGALNPSLAEANEVNGVDGSTIISVH